MNKTIQNSTFSIINKEGHDLIVYQCGMEKCKPSHSYGPAVRDHYLIHFILKGQGTFYVDGKSYRLQENEGFLICPDIVTYYEADRDNPWIYSWVGFKGLKAETYLKMADLSRENPIFKHKNGSLIQSCLEDMRKASSLKYGRELRLQGLLGFFLSELIELAEKSDTDGSTQIETYIKKVIQFIETNYSRDISMDDISKHIGLNRNYFSSLFKEKMKIPPQQYLINYRINKACELMSNEGLTISDISRSVGYNDPLGFSKIFKKLKGCSPREYRHESVKLPVDSEPHK
jgi:AraC-like DNA-binding protein